jgi:hemoglobin
LNTSLTVKILNKKAMLTPFIVRTKRAASPHANLFGIVFPERARLRYGSSSFSFSNDRWWAMKTKQIPTLYEWVGGIQRLETLFMKFYERVPADPVLAPIFAEMPAEHFRTVAHFVGEVLGGPPLYSGDGNHGHATMVAKHLGKHLNNEQRKQWMALLLDTADQLALPDDPEFRSALVGYLEWGSRLAVLNSASEENPIDTSAPMPKWGWGEPKGPYQP